MMRSFFSRPNPGDLPPNSQPSEPAVPKPAPKPKAPKPVVTGEKKPLGKPVPKRKIKHSDLLVSELTFGEPGRQREKISKFLTCSLYCLSP